MDRAPGAPKVGTSRRFMADRCACCVSIEAWRPRDARLAATLGPLEQSRAISGYLADQVYGAFETLSDLQQQKRLLWEIGNEDFSFRQQRGSCVVSRV